MPFDYAQFHEDTFADVIRSAADLHDYQREAENFLYDNLFSALFIDVGMGKTVIVNTLLDRLFDEGFEDKVLIVAPIRVATRVWMQEHRIWRHTAYMRPVLLRIPDDDMRLRLRRFAAHKRARANGYNADMAAKIATRSVTKRKDELRTQLLDSKSRIHVIDHGSAEWLVKKCVERRKWPYKIVIFDESSRLGDHTSLTFKALQHVRGMIDRLHELTATPAAQTYMRLFSQIWLLDKGERFGNFITHFRSRYFDFNPYRKTYTLKPGAAEAIERKFADLCFVLKREDRDTIIRTHPIRLSAELMRTYRKFERTALLEIPDGDPIEALTAANLSSKLLQLASGAVYDADRQYHVLHDEKIEFLKELAEQTLDQPLLVSYWFRSSLARLQKAFPKAAVMDREGNMERPWNQGKFKMLLVHPRSVGHGLNMQFGGHHLVLFDIFWSLELFLQLIGRLDRQGQLYTVIVHLLSTVGTHDEVVTAKLEYLEDAQDAMYRRLKALHKAAHRST